MTRSLRDGMEGLRRAAMALLLIGRMEWARRRNERALRLMRSGRWRTEPAPWPPRAPDGAIDWSGMSYVEVNDTDYAFSPATLEALMQGPVKRMLDICDDGSAVRASARVMEFARGPVWRFKDRHARSADEARRVDEVVMAELERRFAGRGSDGRYLIDVFLGRRDHNGCVLAAAPDDEGEAR